MMKSMLASTKEPTSCNEDSNQSNQSNLPMFDFGESYNGGNYPAFMTTRKTKQSNNNSNTLIAMKKPKVFQSTSAKKRFKLPVSDSLPHMKFRIGGKDSKFSIEVAVDTCAAMNLAYKNYHTKIYERYPHLVAKYTAFRKEVEALTTTNKVSQLTPPSPTAPRSSTTATK
jgi:hypothetical protein